MIKNRNDKYNDYSISPKIRQILLRWGYELVESDCFLKYFLSGHSIKMRLKKIKFGDKEVDKKEFYMSKQAISLDSLDLSKIVVSNKWKLMIQHI